MQQLVARGLLYFSILVAMRTSARHYIATATDNSSVQRVSADVGHGDVRHYHCSLRVVAIEKGRQCRGATVRDNPSTLPMQRGVANVVTLYYRCVGTVISCAQAMRFFPCMTLSTKVASPFFMRADLMVAV